MKFQIILEGPYYTDQELWDMTKKWVGTRFKIEEARSLEGLREEVWKRPKPLDADVADDLI